MGQLVSYLRVTNMKHLLCLVFIFLSTFLVKCQQNTKDATNTKLFSGNQALDSGALGFGLGLAASAVVPSLLGGGGCGRRGRSAQNKDGTNTKFFLGNNCGPSYNQPSYPQPGYNPCGRKKRSPQDANSRHYSSSNCGGGSFTS